MAQRKALQLTPILDNEAVNQNPSLEDSKVVHVLGAVQFQSLVRMALSATLEALGGLRNATRLRLEALGVERDLSMAISRKPKKGSNQFDPGSFITWTEGITQEDHASIQQLVTIDATIESRFPKAE